MRSACGSILQSARSCALVVLVLCVATPCSAQYLFLDANGDGVHSSADILAPDATTTADLRLVTNRNRDGGAAACAADPSASMTLNSYEVILRAIGGTVAWGAFTNLLPSATVSFGREEDDRELYVGNGGGEILAPGEYLLARVEITPTSGTPSIAFARRSYVYPAGNTSFGCACLGLDGDNTMKLGQEWLDADGLPALGVAEGPFIDPIPSQVLREGESRDVPVRAADPDGSMLEARLDPALRFAALTGLTTEPGDLRAMLAFRPSSTDSGHYATAVVVSDGTRSATAAFDVQVVDVAPPPPFNPPPTLWPIPDLGVQPGHVREWPVSAVSNDDQINRLELVAGPAFVSLVAIDERPGQSDAIVKLAPGADDLGTWDASIRASDGEKFDLRTFRVTVGPNHPPQFGFWPAIALLEGQSRTDLFTMGDPDADSLGIEVTGVPAFVEFATTAYRHGFGEMIVTTRPGPGDAGSHSFEVRVTDGFDVVSRPVPITVFPQGTLEAFWSGYSGRCVELGSARYWGLSVQDAVGTVLRTEMISGPPWISIDASRSNAAMLSLSPGATVAVGAYPILLGATAPDGRRSHFLGTATVKQVGGCYVTGSILHSGLGEPTAVAGGPYRGYVGQPVRFDGRWSSDGGAPIGYSWKFGDGSTGPGAVAEHRYASSGTYTVVLHVGNANGSSRDTTEAVIHDPIPLAAWLSPANRVVPLTDARATVVLRLEPDDAPLDIAALRAESAVLRAGGLGETDSIGADAASDLAIGDANRNEVPDAELRFRVADLRRLFASVGAKREVTAWLEAWTRAGEFARGEVRLQVVGVHGSGVSVGPNPFNPVGWIRFDVESREPVSVRLYDVAGRMVRTLLDEPRPQPGSRSVLVNGLDSRGRNLPSGIYFYRIQRGAQVDRGRLTILK
ncbi:MAG TPA: PKD domain-containing protein [Candidatus Eisenbacteria bacterium]|nr:PKD domain-containing protein [Candidatus Eisenbacteria bacterium]